MKLPLYLKLLLLVTIGLAVWAQFSGDETGDVVVTNAATPETQKPARVSPPSRVADKQTEAIADLFPVYSTAVKAAPVPAVQGALFPFRATGLWLSEGAKIIMITDGIGNWLLCDACHKAGFVRPGGLITPAWRLQAIAENHVIIESLPGHVQNSVSLNSLNIKSSIK